MRHQDRLPERSTRLRLTENKASRMKSIPFGENQSVKGRTVTFANPHVLEFYKALPFNLRESVASSTEAIQSQDPRLAYPVLRPLLHSKTRVLDVGCGAGWFANSVNYRCGCPVTGIDFNPVAVERARKVARELGLSSEFQVADLFQFLPSEPFDFVVSLGVLHQTHNCAAAVRRVCEFVKPGGHVFIGLYHKYGRQPFLDHFRDMRRQGASEEAMLVRYKELHSELHKLHDDTLLRSWFRDQVLHPHETQHTLEEMLPVIMDAGMELVSTSLNRFAAIESLEKLLAEEGNQRKIAEQRLQQRKYFTGFFLFLARKTGGDGTVSLDSKPYVEHDSLIGYRYNANVNLMLPRPGGGTYHFQTNSEGIRGSREYAFKKLPGTTRIILCGDSMSAGQFVSNEQRMSEQLERRVPGLEIINLSLEGSGTDQQLLLYESVGLQYEHDLVILMPFLSNLRRNMVAAREAFDAKVGSKVLRGKPRFELIGGKLELRNVPVPKEVAPSEPTDTQETLLSRWKARLSALPGMLLIKKVIYSVWPWEPFPEFRDPKSSEWQLMEAIIRRFKQSAGNRPIVIVPTFYDNYLRYHMSRRYWHRFQSLEKIPGVRAIDLLPHFRKIGPEALRCFQSPYDMHFSTYGNLVVAEALEAELNHLGLLRPVEASH
jgi:2-polyprenyl-3-methyl-5-hydroxy-6-metoxy-1,4-benzoquinol methylase